MTSQNLVAHLPLRAGPILPGFLEWNSPQGHSTDDSRIGPGKVWNRVKGDWGKFFRAIPRGQEWLSSEVVGSKSRKWGIGGEAFLELARLGHLEVLHLLPGPQAGSQGQPWAPRLIGQFWLSSSQIPLPKNESSMKLGGIWHNPLSRPQNPRTLCPNSPEPGSGSTQAFPFPSPSQVEGPETSGPQGSCLGGG